MAGFRQGHVGLFLCSAETRIFPSSPWRCSLPEQTVTIKGHRRGRDLIHSRAKNNEDGFEEKTNQPPKSKSALQ